MKKTLLILLLICNLTSYSQEKKWYSSSEIDFIFDNEFTYLYHNGSLRYNSFTWEPDGFLLNTYAIQYDYNYLIFSKLSVGAVGGFEFQKDPNNYPMLKLGAVMRYFFVDDDNVYSYIQVLNSFTVDKEKFKNGVNARIGLGYPVLKEDSYNVKMNLFLQQNHFNLSGAKPIFNIENEHPSYLKVHSFGISFGVQF